MYVKNNQTGKKIDKRTPDKKASDRAFDKELEEAATTPMAIPKMTGSWAEAEISDDEG